MAAVLLYVTSAFVVWMCSFMPVAKGSLVRCPSSCMCLGNNVDCSNFGLINIPKDIPGWVTRLELQSNSITDIRPDDLKGLHSLKYLDLSNNNIHVINGSVFRNLVALQTLKLDYNKLTEIPLLPAPLNIVELTLAHNHVVTIPIQTMQHLPELITLDLSNNFILSLTNGSFPIGSKLQHLMLNSNQICIIEEGSLNNLSLLETLKINKNKVNELPQGVFNRLHSLKALELMRNKIRSIRGLTFQGLNKLQVLKLRRNSITFLKDGAFWGLSNLVSLQIDHNRIMNITEAWLFGLTFLKTLTLSHNKISTIEPEAWVHCKHLQKLDLTYNKLTAITDTALAHLNSLYTLSLDYNQISRIDEGAFKEQELLSTLELNGNHIPWSMEDLSGVFQGLTGLTKLSLRANAIRSIAVHAFASVPNLRILHLEDNDITLIQKNAFEMLKDLEDLRFNSSKLVCDCHLAWLPTWLRQNGFQHSAVGTCYHPPLLRGATVFQVDVADFKCSTAEFPKPVILENPKSAIGFKGENMTLSCVAANTGDSPPRIHWKKDNMIMDSSLSEITATSDGDVKRFTSSLCLTSIQDSMAGHYQCIISNDFGSAFSHKAYVNVYVYPVFVKVPKDVTVKVGKPAELKCAATGQPPPVISWQKDGGDNFPAARERRMQVYPNDDVFYILNTRPSDEGVYSCMAKNEAGLVITNATVTILETPDFVQPMQGKKTSKKGETTVLQCMASGSPQPKLTWLKDDTELVMTPRHFFTVDNQILVIVDTQWSDAGTYACRMSNSLGTAKGTTELQVVSSSGEAGHRGSSFGLDDESTTTGIIVIAVVCCVVGTSLVWVIIIYQTRKRHDLYSATPSDETILPGEAQTSGYISSEKEGSYSQGPVTVSGYHYQDYQLKESGYDSSSGNYQTSSYTHPPNCPGDVDEDDKPPAMTAGDRLLRQFRSANSVSSLPYPSSDGDTTASGHSHTSSCQHSRSSDPPSSHSQTHTSVECSSLNEADGHSSSSTKYKLNERQLFWACHPMKPTNHDRSSNKALMGMSHCDSGGENSDRDGEDQGESKHNFCDSSNVDLICSATNPSQPSCSHCLLDCSMMVDCSSCCECLCVSTDIYKSESNHRLFCSQNSDAKSPHHVCLIGGHLHNDERLPQSSHSSVSLPQLSSSSFPDIKQKSLTCSGIHRTKNSRNGDSSKTAWTCSAHHKGSSQCDCLADHTESSSQQPTIHKRWSLSNHCCCEGMSDLPHCRNTCLPNHREQEVSDVSQSCTVCSCQCRDSFHHHHHSNYYKRQKHSLGHNTTIMLARTSSSSMNCECCDPHLSAVHRNCQKQEFVVNPTSSLLVTHRHGKLPQRVSGRLSFPGRSSSSIHIALSNTIPTMNTKLDHRYST